MAWITINDRHDSANLLDYPPPKGFVSDVVGGFDLFVQSCFEQSEEEILADHYCNCSEMFSPVMKSSLANHNTGIAYRNFVPSPAIALNTTNASLVLQVFTDRELPTIDSAYGLLLTNAYVDNSSGTPQDWVIPGPMMLLMAYDSKLSTMDALTKGLASVSRIPVLGSTTVVISPAYRIGWQSEPYYYYSKLTASSRLSNKVFTHDVTDMETTSIPSINDVCDVGETYVTWCYTTVVLRLRDLTRIVTTREMAASPAVSL